MTNAPLRSVSFARRRRGSVYILIIGVSMLTATITIAATLPGRAQSLSLGTAVFLTSGVLISSNSNITSTSGAVVACNVEAAGTISTSGSFAGTRTAAAAPRTLPGATVFDYYTANGTTISFTSLPLWSGTRAINKAVL